MNLSHSTLFSEYEPVTRPLPSYLQTQRVQRDAHPWTRLVQNFQFNIELPLQNCSPLRTLKKRDWGSTHHPKHCIPALCKRFDGWSFSAGPANLNLEIAIHNTVETSHPRNMFFSHFLFEYLDTLPTLPGDKCPQCNEGTIKRYFTRFGICFAVLCFPIGLSCCYVLKKKR